MVTIKHETDGWRTDDGRLWPSWAAAKLHAVWLASNRGTRRLHVVLPPALPVLANDSPALSVTRAD